MELLVTVAYFFLVRLVFFDFKLLKYNLFWKFVTIGLWVAAAMTEVIFLGQYTPYSKSLAVQSYVVQMAPEVGGLVKEVYVTPNQPVKKGTPLFQMDPTIWQYELEQLEAELQDADTDVAELNEQVAEARAAVHRVEASLEVTRVTYAQLAAAAATNAVSLVRLEQVEKQVLVLEAELESAQAVLRGAQIAFESEVGDQHTAVAKALAALNRVKYHLEKTTVRAPSDGYVANLQLHPGTFVMLKQPIMAFVSTEKFWLGAIVPQRGIHRLRPGDKAQVAFEMYPGKVFDAKVDNVVWAAGDTQGVPSGRLPDMGQVRAARVYMVRLEMEQDPDYPLRFGASGLAAMYSSDAADILIVLRQIELQSESFLNYLYNPFE